MENRTLNWLKGRLSYFKLVAIYLAILISLTFFVSAYGSADVSYSSDDYPQLNRYEDVEEHKTAESVRAAAKGNKVYDVARAAQKASKAASKARNAGNLLDSVKKMFGSKTGSLKGGKTPNALEETPFSKTSPDFYATPNKKIVPSHTPAGREITPHAADRMANPPLGRSPMSPNEVDNVIDTGSIMKVDDLTKTTTYGNPTLPGNPLVVTSDTHDERIVTVIKKILRIRK